MAEWWDKAKEIPLTDPNFQKIVQFYLFHCPCEIEKRMKKGEAKTYTKVSKRAKTLREQGWTGGHLNTLLAAMKRRAGVNLKYRPCDAREDVCAEARQIENDSSLHDIYFEMIVFTEHPNMRKTSSIFYYIRNALAHGTFSYIKDKKAYYFESSTGDSVKARIRLKEKTLLDWIKDFEFSPQTLKSALSNESKKNNKQKKGAVA